MTNPYDHDRPKGEQVREMFDRIARRYDLLNHVLSLGIDRGWRRCVLNEVARENPRRVLDVATGTGDLAMMIARRVPGAVVVGADLSEGMVEVGRTKVCKAGLGSRVDLRVADAGSLDRETFGEFDVVTAAFGVRNFEDVALGLRAMRSVLREGGKVWVLEFSTPRNKAFGALYNFYFHRVLPVVGGMVSGDRKAYGYLPRSVGAFASGEDFLELLRGAGFSDCSMKSLTLGVAHIYRGVNKAK